MQEYIYIDLSEYYNHRSIMDEGDSADELKGFDASLEGKFFISSSMPKPKDTVTCNESRFIFSSRNSENYDNISCEEQHIEVDKGSYREIHLLGCSECGKNGGWLGITEKIKLIFEDNSEELIDIFFYDWWRGGGNFDFETYQKCTPAVFAKDHEDVARYLYSNALKIENSDKILTAVEIPYNPCLHIYAITLKL